MNFVPLAFYAAALIAYAIHFTQRQPAGLAKGADARAELKIRGQRGAPWAELQRAEV